MIIRYKAIVLLIAVAVGGLVWWGCKPYEATVKAEASAYAGSASCRECHAEAYDRWSKSNHGLAERPVEAGRDQAAFVPARTFQHGSQTTAVALTNGNFIITSKDLSGQMAAHRVDRVIGNDPLQQYLVAAPGGRWQTMEASYDPHRNEWFNVFGQDDRQPGEWGHWTGRGMTWNTMCADCHNTRLRKNYDEATDSYHTTMSEPKVTCEACHGPLQAHVTWRKQYHNTTEPDSTMPKRTPAQILDTCGSCHARRAELTGEFQPGDKFTDHFDLTIVDHSDTFYPDGQIRDEDYEYTAFLGSKMHQAGVTCIDCHTRSLHTPALKGNAMCLRCHAGGYLKAPIISPEEHSHHAAGGAGDQCISCHMPVTAYMQRHPRHDHGLTIPDPSLTVKFNIPNACNRCHTDKSADWSLTAVTKWYGAKMERPTRARAEWVARARQGDVAAKTPLLAVLQNDTNAYWQAVAAGLLDQWVDEPDVTAGLTAALTNQDALVRGTAIRSLEPLAQSSGSALAGTFSALLNDPSRNVRINAAWALRATVDTNSPAGRELVHFLDLNADQPVGQMQKGEFEFARGDLNGALGHYQKAVAWDANSAPLRHEYAVALSAASRPQEAITQLEAASRLAPKEAEYFYDLGLAWNELGDVAKTIASLESAVALDPRHARAWYNLGLARNAAGQPEEALTALVRAESVAPTDARIPYARATILAKAGHPAEARAAVQRALEVQPDFPAASQLLQMLAQ